MDFGGGGGNWTTAHSESFESSQPMESKRAVVVRNVRTRRRETPYAALSHRVTRLSKSLKAVAPTHLLSDVYTATQLNTASFQLECYAGVAQGDAYNQRHGNQILCTHLKIMGSCTAGSTATGTTNCRLVVYKASSLSAGIYSFLQTYNPIYNIGVIQLIHDEYFQVAGPAAGQPYSKVIRRNIKLRHKQKFSGAAAATTAGDSIYVEMFSSAAAGTTAPIFNGRIEEYFKP